MSQQRQYHHQHQHQHHHQMVNVGGGNNAGGQFGDTTFTKIFVGGLAWETKRETMGRYFEQFGEIQEAVVITDKNTGRSKGYGFVTFKDAESAMRACQDPSPVIDGRRANCNLASLGAQRTTTTRPATSQHGMGGRYRAASGGAVAPPPPPPTAHQPSSSTYNIHQPAHYGFPYSAYGYSGYSQENMYPMNYYNVYGGQGQQFSPYFAPAAAAAAGAACSTPHGGAIYPNFYPFYAAQYAQNSQTQGFGYQYHPQMIPYPYVPQHFSTATTGILSLPASVASMTSIASGTGGTPTAGRSGTESVTSQITAATTAAGGNTADQSSSLKLT